MNADWLADGRKIPDDVMLHIRIMAVHAVRVLGLSPELVAKAYILRVVTFAAFGSAIFSDSGVAKTVA